MSRRLVHVLGRILHPGGRKRARRPSRRSRAVLGCVVATALVAVGVGPASAHGVRFKDAAGDMTAFNESEEGVAVGPAPNHRAGDVKSVVVRHGQRAVTVKVALAQLRRSHFNSFSGKLRTGTVTRQFSLLDESNARPRLFVFNKRFEPVCGGATFDVDYQGNTLAIRFPRTCLKRPNWVEAQAVSANDPRDGSNTYYIDDVFNATPFASRNPGARPTWSARVYSC